MKKHDLYLVVIVMMGLLAAFTGMAQEQATKYTPTEIQSLRVKVALQDAQLSEINKNKADQDFADKLKIFNDVVTQVKKDQGWPDTVQWSFGKNSFIDTNPPQPATPTPAPMPTPAPAK